MAQKLNVLYLLVKKSQTFPWLFVRNLGWVVMLLNAGAARKGIKITTLTNYIEKQAYTKSDKCKRTVIETAILFINADFNMFVYCRLCI